MCRVSFETPSSARPPLRLLSPLLSPFPTPSPLTSYSPSKPNSPMVATHPQWTDLFRGWVPPIPCTVLLFAEFLILAPPHLLPSSSPSSSSATTPPLHLSNVCSLENIGSLLDISIVLLRTSCPPFAQNELLCSSITPLPHPFDGHWGTLPELTPSVISLGAILCSPHTPSPCPILLLSPSLTVPHGPPLAPSAWDPFVDSASGLDCTVSPSSLCSSPLLTRCSLCFLVDLPSSAEQRPSRPTQAQRLGLFEAQVRESIEYHHPCRSAPSFHILLGQQRLGLGQERARLSLGRVE